MSSEMPAVRVESLGKCYQLYANPRDRLKQFVMPRLRRAFGLPQYHYYREFWALSDIAFEVNKGETVGIIGRNGAGKSTLLQILCGTLTPTSGSVHLSGRVAALLELGAGFNTEFTGRENVYLNASVLGLSRAEIDARLPSILAFADIGDFIDQTVKTYSSGMVVRLAFAVIAHVDADVLIIDEALAVGDAFFVQKCMRFLREFMSTGTVLFVSHDSGAVINLCQRAIWLDQGRVRQIGSPKEVAEAYLKDQYLSTQQNVDVVPADSSPARPVSTDECDQRQAFINASNLRNDIKVRRFDPGAPSFGAGSGAIVDAWLASADGKRLSWVVGGEIVRIMISARFSQALDSLGFGFYVKDRLGQHLFGDNTILTYLEHPLNCEANEKWTVSFSFRMPMLPVGDYSVDIAMGNGSKTHHVIQHWMHDALTFSSHAGTDHQGLVGIPMLDIRVDRH